MTFLDESWSRLDAWLAKHAPRTHATLLAGVDADAVRAVVAKHGLEAPDDLVLLYGLAGGQRSDPNEKRRGGARGIFRGFWFLPLDELDEVVGDFAEARKGGAAWAKPNRFPFAKDFAGSYLVVEEPTEADDHVRARIVETGACEEYETDGLDVFVETIWENLDCGLCKIDESFEDRERHLVLFDACRPRTAGDIAKHSVFEALGIKATVEDLSQLFGMFDKKPPEMFGLAVRLVCDREIDIEDVSLVDADDQTLPANAGKSSGGGKPGVLVFVWDRRPLRNGSRLRVTIASIRRV